EAVGFTADHHLALADGGTVDLDGQRLAHDGVQRHYAVRPQIGQFLQGDTGGAGFQRQGHGNAVQKGRQALGFREGRGQGGRFGGRFRVAGQQVLQVHVVVEFHSLYSKVSKAVRCSLPWCSGTEAVSRASTLSSTVVPHRAI